MASQSEDMFVEQLVKRSTTSETVVKRISLILMAIVICFIPLLFIPTWSYYLEPVAIIISFFLVWGLWKRALKEYEYIFTDGNLDIDVIYGRSSRKHVVTVDTPHARLICPADDEIHRAEINAKYQKTLKANPGDIDEGTYVILAVIQSQEWKIYFEPSEEMIRQIKRAAPRVTIVKRK